MGIIKKFFIVEMKIWGGFGKLDEYKCKCKSNCYWCFNFSIVWFVIKFIIFLDVSKGEYWSVGGVSLIVVLFWDKFLWINWMKFWVVNNKFI